MNFKQITRFKDSYKKEFSYHFIVKFCDLYTWKNIGTNENETANYDVYDNGKNILK